MIVLPSMPLRNPNVALVYHAMHFTEAECDTITASAIDSQWREGGVGGQADDQSTPSVVGKVRSCLEQRLPVDQRSGAGANDTFVAAPITADHPVKLLAKVRWGGASNTLALGQGAPQASNFGPRVENGHCRVKLVGPGQALERRC